MRALAGERFEAYSAGSEPTQPNPFALRVLQDEGIDVLAARAKSVEEFANQSFDFVITLCAEEVCPVWLGAGTRLHWPLPDPAAVEGTAEEKLAAFHHTAAELERRLNEFVSAQPIAADS